jgi:glycerol-3-phosphate dehydrogenase
MGRQHMRAKKSDVAIIGAGIIGCAIARELSFYDLKVSVLEKEHDAGWGTTKANSGIIHAGYAGEKGTLKLRLCHKGNLLFRKAARELSIPFKQTGSLLNITDTGYLKNLEALYEQGRQNGLRGLRLITDNRAIKELEPNISKDVAASLHASEAAVTSPYEACLAFYENALFNGAEFFFDFPVESISREGAQGFCIRGKEKLLEADIIINAAGIHSARVASMIDDGSFKIIPVKGQYILFDKQCSGYVNLVNFMMPEGADTRSKGILVSPTVAGNFFAGPDYEPVSTDDLSTSRQAIGDIKANVHKMYPDIPYEKAITYFAGLRAVSDTGDFIIGPSLRDPMFFNACGIQSPGLTCCLSIAQLIKAMVLERKGRAGKRKSYEPTRKAIEKFETKDIMAKKALHKKERLYGEIVCRCENVTEAEVVEAIRRGSDTLDGIKFRTRAGMGRCQGGYCAIKVMRIINRETGIPFEKITKCGSDSYIARYKI